MDHLSKWAEIIPFKKASGRIIADSLFDNYILHYAAPVKLIKDNFSEFISYIFEYLSNRLGIRHVKTVVYSPQANITERVNHDLVQMIANYVNDQHDTWDQFLRKFAYDIRTAVIETTGKMAAELFLGEKLITPFQKLVMVSVGTEVAVEDIEKLFDEARRDTKAKHEKWAKYYDRRRRDVQIKFNDWILVKTHPLSSSAQKVVAKFKPKFEVNVDQVRLYHHRESDEMEIRTSSSDNNRSSYKSNNFEGTQPGSDESQYWRDETVRPRTSGYNFRPRRGAKVEIPDQPMRSGHNKEDQFDPEEAGRNHSKDPTSRSKEGHAAGISEAEVGNNSIASKGKEERTATDPSLWMS
ncbi:retrovirus-related Pol polyprotein from transposon 17.6 [Trichonephila clavipes]|nr:retrovirus-related Pol polyprotein from transposon 17.6 [Trichonephila clavipes]